MKDSILRDKSFEFALRIVKLCKYIHAEHREYVLSKQVMRSGTSVGANIVESNFGSSKLDFIHKLTIAQKEAAETNYWIRLLEKGEYISVAQAESLLNDCTEIQKMLAASVLTARKALERDKKS